MSYEAIAERYARAIFELNSGNPDAATADLNRAIGEGYSVRLLEADPEFTSINQHSDFRALLSNSADAR